MSYRVLILRGGTVVGRNEPCPCGSGRKFKKCCINKTGIALSSKSKLILRSLSFTEIISAEFAEELPFFQIANVKDLPSMALGYLEEDTLSSVDVGVDIENKICAKLVFHDHMSRFDRRFKEDNRYYGYDWDDEDEIEIFLSEISLAGPIKIEVFCNKKPAELTAFSGIVNATLIFIWLALSSSIDRKRLPSEVREFHKKFNEISKRKKYLDQQFAAIKEELKSIALDSISISIDPVLADGTQIKGRDPQFQLPDQMQRKKIKNVQILAEEFSSNCAVLLNRRRQNLPDSFVSFSHSAKLNQQHSSNHHLHRLTNVVNYYFSDGAVVSSGEILSTKYAMLLPPDLLPGEKHIIEGESVWGQKFNYDKNKSSTNVKLQEIELTSEESHFIRFQKSEVEIASQIVLKLVESVSRRLNSGEIDVYLKFCDNEIHNVLQLAKIEVSTANLFSWDSEFIAKSAKYSVDNVIVAGQLSLQRDTNIKGQVIPLKAGILCLDNKTLYLHNIVNSLQRIDYLERIGSGPEFVRGLEAVKSEISTWPNLSIKLTAQGIDNYNSLKENLKNELKLFAKISTDSRPSSVKSKPELHVNSEGHFLLTRRLLSDETAFQYPYLNGFSTSFLKVLKILQEGLPGLFGSEAKELASQSRHKREFELKLLKHLGVLNLLVFEILSVRFQSSMSDGKMLNQADEILPHLEKKILLILGESEEFALVELCSKSVYDLLKKFIRKFSELVKKSEDKMDIRSQMLLCEGEFVLENMFEDELRLFYQVLNYSVLASSGEVFLKPRFSLLSKIFPFDGLRLGECNLSSSRNQLNLTQLSAEGVFFQLPLFNNQSHSLLNTLGIFQDLLKFNFEFYVNGQLIQELNNDDFQAELILLENSSGEAKQLGSAPINWFELNPRVFLHGTEISIQEAGSLLKDGIIEHKGRFYLIPAKRLPSLKRLSNFWERLREGKKLNSQRLLSEQIFQVPKSQVLEMLALRSSGIAVTGGKRWQEICDFYDNLEINNRSVALPKTINAVLKPYQKTGVQWLYELNRLGLGAVLADDMGLGKTLQTLAFLETLRSESAMGAVLIIVPTSLTYNWLSEKEKFVPNLLMQIFSSKSKEDTLHFLNKNSQAVVLTTYGLMHEHKEFFQNISWNIIIFDEAQNLKTITSQRTTTARSLGSQTKICLTGTPLENHLGEYYSIFDLVVSGCLGDVDEFRKVFVNSQSIQAEDLRYLKLKSKPLILRRTKKQILDELPDKQESLVQLDFESKQKKIYRDIAISYNDKIQEAISTHGEGKCQLQMLTALLRLRQTCSDPSSLPGVKYEGIPPKLEALKEALFEIVEAGESAIVFTQFLRTLDRTEGLLKSALLPTYVIHGGLTQSQREKVLREFNENSGGAVLLMTLKTGGVGLNLTKASYVFHLEPWWNPAVENQATDRAHRLGQKRSVQVYRYIMHESVEEKIELLKKRKQATFNSVFNDDENDSVELNELDHEKRIGKSGSFLSKEDFSFLLTVN